MVQRPCPNDAMFIPLVAEVFRGSDLIQFFWCWSCMELTAFVGDPGTLAVRFAEDGRGGWRVFHAVGIESEVQAAISAVSHVQADRSTWERRSGSS